MTEKKEKSPEKMPAVKKEEPRYAVEELAAAAARFGVKPECITAAMQWNGWKEATFEEARKLVDSFLKKEVK